MSSLHVIVGMCGFAVLAAMLNYGLRDAAVWRYVRRDLCVRFL